MHTKKIATALAVAACGFGATAATAGAATINGISGNPYSYVGTGANHTFSVSGLTVTCATARYTGTATGASTTSIQAAYGGSGGVGTNCTSGLLGPVAITATGPWTLTATSTTTGTITIPSGSNVTIKPVNIPSCTINVGPQGPLGGLTAASYGSPVAGTNLSGTVSVAYTRNASSCIIPPSGTATYSTAGNVVTPGVVVSP
jgi:hypothetical protein